MELYLVTTEEVHQLATVVKQTFFDTYAQHNSPENMANYLKNHFNTERLTSEILNPNMDYYFSKKGKEITGYIKLNYADAQTDIKDNISIEIERIYVLKEYQRQGLGRFLCDKTVQIAQTKGKSYIWLGVWQKNPNAIAFYKRLGFEVFGEHVFDFEGDPQLDYLMKLEVK